MGEGLSLLTAAAAGVWLACSLAAFAVALVVSLAMGKSVIRALARLKLGQRVRDDGPQRHLQKEGTPTMGGVLIVGATVLSAALAGVAFVRVGAPGMFWPFGAGHLWLLAAATIAFAAIGFADDWLKIKRGRALGLKARHKLALQFLAAVGFVLALGLFRTAVVRTVAHGESIASAFVPYSAVAVLWVFAVAFTSNAVNLADGLDGLAAGVCAIAALGFSVLSWFSGVRDVAPFGMALCGACVGFLWFNRHPAQVFMGDVGSLALGGALAGMAVVLGSPLALLGLCMVPFAEAASVIIQVISFKTTGKRVFKMSPIHHHFELSGWSERRVVWTFWAVAAVAAVATLMALTAVNW